MFFMQTPGGPLLCACLSALKPWKKASIRAGVGHLAPGGLKEPATGRVKPPRLGPELLEPPLRHQQLLPAISIKVQRQIA